MKPFLLMLTMSLFLAIPAWAVPITNCDKLMWDPNTEPDLAAYHVYVTKDGVAQPAMPVMAPTAEVTCAGVNIVEGANYAVQLTAIDMSGNESAKTAAIMAEWPTPPDTTPPDPPTGTCLMTLDAVTGLQCVMAP